MYETEFDRLRVDLMGILERNDSLWSRKIRGVIGKSNLDHKFGRISRDFNRRVSRDEAKIIGKWNRSILKAYSQFNWGEKYLSELVNPH